jgi:LysR family glycine cleavage system transcriptional activator
MRNLLGLSDDWRSSVPLRLDRLSLEALRVFEAAARHANFTAAAQELRVTQAAVSRRIQGLESDLGAALFERRGRRLSLTPAGDRLRRRVRGALDHLAEALEDFALGPEGATVSLAAPGSVSHLWLPGPLAAFADARPDLTVRLTTSDAMGDLAAGSHDLAILYGSGAHPRWRLAPLLPERLAPVASPAYLAARGLSAASAPPADILALDLIDYEPFNAHWITLSDWLGWAGARGRARPRRLVSAYALAVDAALRGEGVALGSLALLAAPLAGGALVRLGGPVWETGFSYRLGLPVGRPSGPPALALHAALTAAALEKSRESVTS